MRGLYSVFFAPNFLRSFFSNGLFEGFKDIFFNEDLIKEEIYIMRLKKNSVQFLL